MSSIKRYTMAYDYNLSGEGGCTCDIEEDRDGCYVEYADYMKLLAEYEEETRRARLQPADLKLGDVTQRTVLQSLMNLHMSWIIKLCLRLDCRTTHEDMIRLREYFAQRIDQQAGRK